MKNLLKGFFSNLLFWFLFLPLSIAGFFWLVVPGKFIACFFSAFFGGIVSPMVYAIITKMKYERSRRIVPKAQE